MLFIPLTRTPDSDIVMWYISGNKKALTVLPSRTLSIMASIWFPAILSTSCRGFSVSQITFLTWLLMGSLEWIPLPALLAASWASLNSESVQLSLTLARPKCYFLKRPLKIWICNILPLKKLAFLTFCYQLDTNVFSFFWIRTSNQTMTEFSSRCNLVLNSC